MDSGRATQSINFQAGIVSDYHLSRSGAAVFPGLFFGIGLKGRSVLDHRGQRSEIRNRPHFNSVTRRRARKVAQFSWIRSRDQNVLHAVRGQVPAAWILLYSKYALPAFCCPRIFVGGSWFDTLVGPKRWEFSSTRSMESGCARRQPRSPKIAVQQLTACTDQHIFRTTDRRVRHFVLDWIQGEEHRVADRAIQFAPTRPSADRISSSHQDLAAHVVRRRGAALATARYGMETALSQTHRRNQTGATAFARRQDLSNRSERGRRTSLRPGPRGQVPQARSRRVRSRLVL